MEVGGSNSFSNSTKRTSILGPNGKLLVELSPTGHIVGPNASKFSTAIGEQVRLYIPINIKDWRLVDDCFKDAIWTGLTEMFEFNVEGHIARPMVEANYPQKLRSQKAVYRSKYLAKAANIEEAKANIPPSINPALWNEFVDREFQDEVKERNAKNKVNRSLNTIGGTHGRQTFSQKHYELEKKDPNLKLTRVDDWLKARERKDGTVLESARETYDKIKEVHTKILESGGTSGDISSDALSQVLGKETKNRVRGVGSYITKKQLQAACAAIASVNQSLCTSAAVAEVKADVATIKGDISELKSMFQIIIQGQMRATTPRIEGSSCSGKRLSPIESHHDTIPAFGSSGQIRVTLLDKDEREVAKGWVDVAEKNCHNRKMARKERRVYIDEVLVPDCPVYDGPQDGNQTLNAWLEGGFIIWLDGQLKYDT